MCGIIGYTGSHLASPILVSGLRRLEYRGYDSAGLATLDREGLAIRKQAGRVRVLEQILMNRTSSCPVGLTRCRGITSSSSPAWTSTSIRRSLFLTREVWEEDARSPESDTRGIKWETGDLGCSF